MSLLLHITKANKTGLCTIFKWAAPPSIARGRLYGSAGNFLVNQWIFRFDPISAWTWPMGGAGIKVKAVSDPALAGK
jgi:hypothetical protein